MLQLYSLNKDMLVKLICETNNLDNLSNTELREKKNSIRNILLKRKAEKLNENVEHKEIIEKHYKYLLSAKVTFYDDDDEGSFIVIKSKRGIIYVNSYNSKDIFFNPQYSDNINFGKLRKISNDLESYKKIIPLLEFLEKIEYS